MKIKMSLMPNWVLGILLLTSHVFVAPPVQGSEGPLNTDELSKFHPVHVGVVLNMNSVVGSMADICLSMALDDFYDLQYDYKTRVVLNKRHADDVVSAASAVIDLLGTGEVVAIIGPQKSIEATFAIEFGLKVQVPVITFSVTSPSISHTKNPYFIRTSQNDSYQVQALTELIQGFSWDEIVLIYEDTVYGNGIIPYLTDSLQKSNIKITYKCAFLKEASDTQILEELNRMRGLETQVFLVHMMTTSLGSQLFERANDVGLMTQGYAWIITDGLSNSLDDLVPIAIDSMDGVLGIRPYIPKSIEQANFKTRWKKKYYSLKPDNLIVSELNIFGLWAYDTVQALAKAVEDIWPLRSPLYIKPSRKDSNPISNLGRSQEGPRLLSKILDSKPTQGLSGDFHIVNGQLDPLALEIFNVIGNGERVIGYWTPKNGMSKSLTSPKSSARSSVNNLRKIIWPGDSTVKPLGSSIPRTLKKLKIGVPRMIGFPDLGQLVLNQTTNKLMPIGYCIDVFKAVVDALPDPIKFEYELQYYPPPNSYDRTSSYDELLYQVYNKTLDAVVGDTTIVADRWYVDFTLPYSDSGVSMVVPRRNLRPRTSSGDMFIFLKPFYWGLWVAVVVAFIATLLSIGFLRKMQHGENEERWCLIWIPMASIFANGESQLDNRSRLVLAVWLLGMSVLMGSYTASFNSIVMSESHNGNKVDVSAKDVYIGYQAGSNIVKDVLLKKLKIDAWRIRSYTSLEQYDEALSKGSARGGVSAIVDETPYLKLLIAKFGSKYKLQGPTYKTEGFAFAFPMGSPLVSLLSKAILNITESGIVEEIERKYFKADDSSLENDQSNASYRLQFVSFAGLFLLKFLLVAAIVLTLPAFWKWMPDSWPWAWPWKWPTRLLPVHLKSKSQSAASADKTGDGAGTSPINDETGDGAGTSAMKEG